MKHITNLSKSHQPAPAQSLLVLQQKAATFGTLATALGTLATATNVISNIGLNIWDTWQEYKSPDA